MKTLNRIALVAGLLTAAIASADDWKNESGKGREDKAWYPEESRSHDRRNQGVSEIKGSEYLKRAFI